MSQIENPNVTSLSYVRSNVLTRVVFYTFSVLTLGLLYLVFEWFPRLQLWLYQPAESYTAADYVICTKTDGTFAVSALIKAKRMLTPGSESRLLIYFYLDAQVYYRSAKRDFYKKLENKFMSTLRADPCSVELYNSGLEESSVTKLRELYGRNEIDIDVRSVAYYLWEEVKTPIMLFEFSAAIVFAFNEYLLYSAALVVFVGFTCITVAFDVHSSKRKMYDKANCRQDVTVVRRYNGAVVRKRILSSELVIGDVVLVASGDIFTCDMLVTHGTCLVSEAVLTGESNPIAKTGLLNDGSNEVCIGKRQSLYSGANCVASKTKEVRAIVVRTGWNTTKGNLIADVINTKATEFKFKTDVYKVLAIMLVVAILSCGALLYFQLTRGGFSLPHYIGKSLEILTTALPPALFFSFTMGQELANKRLKAKGICSLLTAKINEGGRVKYIGFDKTGTLTETSVRVDSYLAADDFDSADGTSKLFELFNSQHYRGMLEVMACCHSLNVIDERAAGDPLDEEMFRVTKFALEETSDNRTGTLLRKINPSAEFKRKYNLGYNYKYDILATNDFTPERRCVSVIVRGLGETQSITLAKGAPEQIKEMCAASSLPVSFDAVLKEYAEKGYRILALAKGDTIGSGIDIEKDLNFVGFVMLSNKLKPDSKETLAALKRVDVCTFMVSGDNLYTSLNVSFNSGMLAPQASVFVGEYTATHGIRFTYYSNRDIRSRMSSSYVEDLAGDRSANTVKTHAIFSYAETPNLLATLLAHCARFRPTQIAVEGEVFEKLFMQSNDNAAHLPQFYEHAVIFARASPDHKAAIVEKLKDVIKNYRSSYCVAFVGDGSNDCKALKTANVGLSLGNNESSIASAFNTERLSIAPVLDLLLEGRSSLEVAMQNFKFIMVACFFQFFSIVLLLLRGLDFTNADYYLFDIFTLIPLSALMSQTPAAQQLNKNLPRISIINREILASVGGHLIFASLTLMLIMELAVGNQAYKGVPDVLGAVGELNMDEHYFCQNKLLIIAINMLTVAMCLAVNRGYPFRKSLLSNVSLLLYVLALIGIHLLIAADIDTKWRTWDYYFTSLTRQAAIEPRLRFKFGCLLVVACLFMFLYEKAVNTYYLTKKRQLNELSDKGKNSNLAKSELKIMDDLMDTVSLN